MNDWLDWIGDAVREADTTDWITAVIAGVIIQLIVLLIFRIAGFFLRMVTWFIASAISLLVALWILDRRGLPESIGGKRIEDWIDDARRSLGV